MSFREYRQTHNITKEQVYKGSGLKRCTLATIENNTGKAYTHHVLQLIQYYKALDPAVSTKTFID